MYNYCSFMNLTRNTRLKFLEINRVDQIIIALKCFDGKDWGKDDSLGNYWEILQVVEVTTDVRIN